ncbi:MAG: hypothetical protein OEV64_04900 [Desulfobulbaceae bacterium]|nr:hypothetical protein [Desulfobulbaceae bacterium]
MDTIISFILAVVGWLESFWDLVLDGAIWLLEGFTKLLGFVFYTIFDGLLLVIESFFSSLDLSAIAFNYAAQWSSLPPQTIWLVNQLAIPQGLSLLVGGYMIRHVLNIIPSAFSRM